MNETAPRNRLLVWCWPENPAILDLLSGHTGISIDDDHYSFWPDTDAWDRGSPVPAPGKERERELYEQAFREDPENGHPAFRGGWLGKVTKESAAELATRFFMKTAYAAQPRAKQRYAADAEGVIYGPDVPYARVYGFAASQSQLAQVRSEWEGHQSSPPEYSWESRSYCTSLVRCSLAAAGVATIASRRRWEVPERFRMDLDRQTQESEVEKGLRVIGVTTHSWVGSFCWIGRAPQPSPVQARSEHE